MTDDEMRDWFAGQPDILGSLLLMGKDECEALCGPKPDAIIDAFRWQLRVQATLRYMAADAMLEARAAHKARSRSHDGR